MFSSSNPVLLQDFWQWPKAPGGCSQVPDGCSCGAEFPQAMGSAQWSRGKNRAVCAGQWRVGSPGHDCGLPTLEVGLPDELERDFGQEHGVAG